MKRRLELAVAVIAATLIACVGKGSGPGYKSGVHPPNRPPSITGPYDTTVTVGDLLVMRFDVHDADGDSITYLNVSVGLTVEEWAEGYAPTVGLMWDELFVWYRPAPRDGDLRWFTVHAEDEHGADGEAPFRVSLEHPASPGVAPVAREDLIFRRFAIRRPRESIGTEPQAARGNPLQP